VCIVFQVSCASMFYRNFFFENAPPPPLLQCRISVHHSCCSSGTHGLVDPFVDDMESALTDVSHYHPGAVQHWSHTRSGTALFPTSSTNQKHGQTLMWKDVLEMLMSGPYPNISMYHVQPPVMPPPTMQAPTRQTPTLQPPTVQPLLCNCPLPDPLLCSL